jgi:hypothetical protein
MVKALHDPIIVQDFIRLHCFAWVVGITGQSLPGPLRRRGESLKTTHDHSAQ